METKIYIIVMAVANNLCITDMKWKYFLNPILISDLMSKIKINYVLICSHWYSLGRNCCHTNISQKNVISRRTKLFLEKIQFWQLSDMRKFRSRFFLTEFEILSKILIPQKTMAKCSMIEIAYFHLFWRKVYYVWCFWESHIFLPLW